MFGRTLIVLVIALSSCVALAAAASNTQSQALQQGVSILDEILKFFNSLFGGLFGAPTTTVTTSSSASTTTMRVTTYTTTMATTTMPPTVNGTTSTTISKTTASSTSTSISISTTSASMTTTTSISTPSTSSASTSTSVTSTTSVIPSNAPIKCKTGNFLRPNQSLSCPPIGLYLIDTGPGNTQYEIANAIVNISYNSAVVFAYQSLLQNATVPYLYNLSNGNQIEVYVYQAHYATYPTQRYANITIIYR